MVSPNFALRVPDAGRVPVLHVDTYRIRDEHELDELGLDEQVEWGATLIVEWPERIESLPPLDLLVQLVPAGQTIRQLKLVSVSKAGGRWLQRVLANLGYDSTAP